MRRKSVGKREAGRHKGRTEKKEEEESWVRWGIWRREVNTGLMGKGAPGLWGSTGRRRESRAQVGRCTSENQMWERSAAEDSMGYGEQEGRAKRDSPEINKNQSPGRPRANTSFVGPGVVEVKAVRCKVQSLEEMAGSEIRAERNKRVAGDCCQHPRTGTPCLTGWGGAGVRAWQVGEEQRQGSRCGLTSLMRLCQGWSAWGEAGLEANLWL